MSPEERLLFRDLTVRYREQQQKPHGHIYLVEDEIDVTLSVHQSENTVRVTFYLISCLFEETSIEACGIVLVYGGYEAPQEFPFYQIKNLLKLTATNRYSATIPVTDAKMLHCVQEARSEGGSGKFWLGVYLTIRGTRDKICRLRSLY